MKCINFKFRTKKNKIYFYCIKHKKHITYKDCESCKYKEYKKVKPIKKKSNKLKNLENKRYSILTDDFNTCYLGCKDKNQKISKHEIYGGRNRQRSMKYGFVIPLCEKCHRKTEEDMDFDKQLKIECEMKYLEDHTKEEFLKIIDIDYLERK